MNRLHVCAIALLTSTLVAGNPAAAQGQSNRENWPPAHRWTMSAGLFTRYQVLDVDYLEDGILLAVDYTIEGPWSASTQDSDLIARGGGSTFSIAALYETA